MPSSASHLPPAAASPRLVVVLGLSLVGLLAACGDDAAATDAATTTTADAPDATPSDVSTQGLGIDYGADPAASVPRYEPTGTDFTATPWPSDRLRTPSLAPDLATFPNPSALPLIQDYVDYAAEALDGWSRNGAIYFQLSAPIDVASLPTAEVSQRDPHAVVQLVNVTPGSAHYGERMPLVFQQHVPDPELPDDYYAGITLALRPVYGFPLADHETYCALLTRAVKDEGGRYLGVAPAFTSALEGEASLAPLRAWLPGASLVAADLAAATCFTTQDATKDLRIVQRFLDERPSRAAHDWKYTGKTQHFHELLGTYETPNFQSGDKPYRTSGGDLKFDAEGEPIVQLNEVIRVRLLVPRNYDMPANGWPVVLYSHGTFGDWATCRDGSESQVLQEGLAMLCIDQPLHGIRAADGVGADVNFMDVFNFLNPRSGRMSFRQAAIDNLWLAKMVADGRFDLAADATTYGKPVKLDPQTIVFFGHSHGGLAGAIVMAIDTRMKGAVLSGCSGVLAETILRRTDPIDIRSTLATVLNLQPEQLDTFHPVMSMAQTLVDATDPVNYAPYWLEPVTGGKAKHVFMTEGVNDALAPAVGADAVSAAAGIPLIEPVDHESEAHALRGLAPVTMPVNSNLQTSAGELVTGGIRQFAGGDHWVALENTTAISIWRGFFRAFRTGDIPTITP